MPSVDEQLDIFRRGTTEIISEDELRAKLREGRPLRVKLGCDPTAPDLHLGHAVSLFKMRELQELGHEIVFIVGDYTAAIGDPSGRNELRPALSRERIDANARTYQDQVFKILDRTRTRVVRNSEWLDPLTFADALRLASAASLKRMIEKDAFEKRFRDPAASIHLHELMYPLVQAYDSVALDADVELGGQDQKFNLLMGRQLQAHFGKPRQAALMMPLIEGTDGKQKMSKSYGNYIGLTEDPKTIFDKVLSVPDETARRYAEALPAVTRSLPPGFLERFDADPREAKRAWAGALLAALGEEPEAIGKVVLLAEDFDRGPIPILDLLVAAKLVATKAEGKRLVAQRGVKVDGRTVEDANAAFDVGEGVVLEKGKKYKKRVVLG